MPLACKWTRPALEDIDHIEAYIAQDNPTASIDIVIKIVQTVEACLTAYPHSGSAGQLFGTRELIISGTPYTAIYRVQESDVQILRVLHQSQKWPGALP